MSVEIGDITDCKTIRVILLPVGGIAEATFTKYATLVQSFNPLDIAEMYADKSAFH